MNYEYSIKELQSEYNCNTREVERLMELCDMKIATVREVYFRSKLFYFSFKLPSNKQEVEALLSRDLAIQHKSGIKGSIVYPYRLDTQKGILYGCQWSSVSSPKSEGHYFWTRRYKFTISQDQTCGRETVSPT